MRTNRQGRRIHGIVLAGVHSWGESILERVCSRPLLPVAGRPLIWYVLDWLGESGVEGATICANSDTYAFRRCMGAGASLGLSVDYYEDIMPRGPAGCVRDAAGRTDADTLVVAEGTIVTEVDLAALLKAHDDAGADLTVVVSPTCRAGGLEPMGVYVASRDVLQMIPTRGYQDIKEVLIPAMHRQGKRVMPYSVPDGSTLRVTGTASYLAANAWATKSPHLKPESWAGYLPEDEAFIHESARVAPTACLVGPIVVGPDCTVEGDVTILGPTSIGSGSRIERDVVIRQAAIWSGCHIGAGAILDDSIVADGSLIEPGMVVRGAICVDGISGRRRRAGKMGSYWAFPTAHGRQIQSADAAGRR